MPRYIPAHIVTWEPVIEGFGVSDSIVSVKHPAIKPITREHYPPGVRLPRRYHTKRYEEMILGITLLEPIMSLVEKWGYSSDENIGIIIAGAGEKKDIPVPFWVHYRCRIQETDFGDWGEKVEDIDFTYNLFVEYIHIKLAGKEVFYNDGKNVRENGKDITTALDLAVLNF